MAERVEDRRRGALGGDVDGELARRGDGPADDAGRSLDRDRAVGVGGQVGVRARQVGDVIGVAGGDDDDGDTGVLQGLLVLLEDGEDRVDVTLVSQAFMVVTTTASLPCAAATEAAICASVGEVPVWLTVVVAPALARPSARIWVVAAP